MRLCAVAVPLDLPNVDTDRIIPARFFRKPRSAGYGQFCFHDLRVLTLRHDAEIGVFEARHVAEWPWAVPARLDGDTQGEGAGATP